jgi:Leucine-rich repeat (LRR) protein
MHNTKQRIATAILLCAGFMPAVSVTAAQQTPVEKRSSAWDLLRKSRSKQTESAETPTKERVVHFPKDRSLGQLYIKDAGSVKRLNYWFHWTDTGEAALQYLGEAQGEVHVPAGKRLFLTVRQTGWKDLSWFSKLGPDDLYGLGFSVLLAEPDKPSDQCMEHIAHLTGLKHLGLDRTDVTDKGFKYVANLSSLEYLSIPYRVTDAGMAYVAELPLLKRLYFGELGSQVTDAGLHHLAKLTALEELALWGERMGDAGLVHLRGLPRLEYLCLYSTHFTDNGLVHLQNLPALRILSVYEGRASITNAGLVHIAQMSKLEILCLGGIRGITDDGLAHLTKTRSLKKLDIGGSQVTDRGLGYLSQIKTLEHLDLPQEQRGITDSGLAYLGQLPNLRQLHVSRIHYNDPKMNTEYYTDKGLEALTRCTGLEELSIGSIGITDAGIDHIAKLPKLKCLHLFGCDNVTDKGLAKLAGIKSLTTLYVSDANITISGLAQLNSLSNLTTLRVSDLRRGGAILDLSGLANLEDLMLGFAPKSSEVFTDADLVSLADLKRLTMVQIGPRDFTDKGIRHLARLPRIERLGVGGPGLTDEGLKSLSDMKTLNHLTIDDGNFTDRGLRFLEGLKLLEFLNVTSVNAFSETAVQHLRNNLPNLHFCRVMP